MEKVLHNDTHTELDDLSFFCGHIHYAKDSQERKEVMERGRGGTTADIVIPEWFFNVR